MLKEPVKSLRHTRRGIGHGHHRAVAGDVGQGLPAWAGEGIGVAHRVSLAQFALNRDHKVAVHGSWRKEDWRGSNPKSAFNGKLRAAWPGGKRLGNCAAKLKTRAAAERRAAARHYAARDCEPRAALRESAC